jgi:hypothetical protein
MELVWKEHYYVFCKHLPIYDMILSPDFLKEIKVHYDMTLEPKIFIENLQMLAYSCVIPQQKIS